MYSNHIVLIHMNSYQFTLIHIDSYKCLYVHIHLIEFMIIEVCKCVRCAAL
jgi:hypothetical protein